MNTRNQPLPLRILPGVIIVVLQWLIRFALPAVIPGTASVGVLGGLAGGLALLIWWGFFSRATRSERWGGVIIMVIALIAMHGIVDESIRTGMQGMMPLVFAVPVLSLAFVVWALACRRLPGRIRYGTMVATILIACGAWSLLRSDGISGDAGAYFKWRWAKTTEAQFMARSSDETSTPHPATGSLEREAEWPGFRGPQRNSIIAGIQLDTDWNASPPATLWRQPVGPGCSSFAVHGDLIYTQEQRGEEESVTCYNLKSGELVWRYSDMARFWDSHAGAGPRATPTLKGGRVYTLGATGILNVLEAREGRLLWSRNAAEDTQAEHSGWGFTSSPLVVDSLVIIAAAGTLAAYQETSGELSWLGPNGGKGYSSPHWVRIAGVEQILLLSELGITSVMPADGKVLWKHEWPEERIVQPAFTEEGDILLSAGGIKGIRRLHVEYKPGGWEVREKWTSVQLKPNFNDIVVHKGYVFGFVGPSIACVDVMDGKRRWRGGRYGGQMLLLADQDLLLVLTEKGELALVGATAEAFTEVARFPVIEGKTWNHPVLVGDVLLVRNAQEMAAFRLSLKAGFSPSGRP